MLVCWAYVKNPPPSSLFYWPAPVSDWQHTGSVLRQEIPVSLPQVHAEGLGFFLFGCHKQTDVFTFFNLTGVGASNLKRWQIFSFKELFLSQTANNGVVWNVYYLWKKWKKGSKTKYYENATYFDILFWKLFLMLMLPPSFPSTVG